MKNDYTQKLGYEKYWGRILEFQVKEGPTYSNLETEWQALNLYEQKDAPQHYEHLLIGGEVITCENGADYLELKKNYITSELDKLVYPTTDAVIELGSGRDGVVVTYEKV